MPKFSKRSLDALNGVHPKLVHLLNTAIKDSPIDFTIIDGVRSTNTQKEYYSWGRTKINPNTGKMTKVTNADGVNKLSNHQVKSDGYGYAVDLYPFINGKINFNDTKSLMIISKHIKNVASNLNIKIRAGIDWKNPYDPPHFELLT